MGTEVSSANCLVQLGKLRRARNLTRIYSEKGEPVWMGSGHMGGRGRNRGRGAFVLGMTS